MDIARLCQPRRVASRLALAFVLLAADPARTDDAAAPVLLADAESATFNSEIPGAALRRQLIGLYIDDSEHNGLLVLAGEGTLLLPLERILREVGATLAPLGEDYRIDTPAGSVALAPSELVSSNGTLLIDISTLNRLLRVQARFDPGTYAVHLSLPWSPAAREAVAQPTRQPAFRPPTASVRNLRADFNYFSADEGSDSRTEYFAAGNLGGGIWQARVEQDGGESAAPYDYYWHRARDTDHLLLGSASYSLHPLLPAVEQTGAQLVYSNRGFDEDTGSRLRSLYGENASGTRQIAGTAEPGAIAELRINGGTVGRTRVRLDGSFEFSDVDVPTRGGADIEVLVLDRSGVLLETRDYSQRAGGGQLASGQHRVFSALGQEGNPLLQDNHSMGTTGALHWRYGVSDRLTLELGHQRDGAAGAGLAGASLSLGRHWFSRLAFADSVDRDAVELTLEGGDARWRADITAREYRSELADEPRRQWTRYGRYSYRLAERFELGLSGRDSRTGYEDTQFLLPTLSWGDGRYLSFNARPNIDGDYRLDSRFTPTWRDTLRYTYENRDHFLDLRHRNRNGIEYYGNLRGGEELDTAAEVGFIRHAEHRLYERSQFGLVATGGRLGFTAQWDARLLPGVQSRLSVSDNAFSSATLDVETGFTVQWDLSLDFAFSRGGVVAAESYHGSNASAALVGPVTVDGKALDAAAGVDRLTLVVDGVSYTAAVQGGEYYIDGLPPGIHRVSVDPRDLPIHLVPAPGQVYWVELGRAAATHVPLALQVRYAVAGRARNAGGNAVAGLALRVVDAQGRVLRRIVTDPFGFYRADDLPRGDYAVEAMDAGKPVARRDVTVTDAFLFGQDLLIP